MSLAPRSDDRNKSGSLRIIAFATAAAIVFGALTATAGYFAGKSSGVSHSEVTAMIAASEAHQASLRSTQAKSFHSILIERQNASYLKGKLLALQASSAFAAAPVTSGGNQEGVGASASQASEVLLNATNCKTPKQCQAASKKMPNKFTTPGTPPPPDGNAPGGGAQGQTFN